MIQAFYLPREMIYHVGYLFFISPWLFLSHGVAQINSGQRMITGGGLLKYHFVDARKPIVGGKGTFSG
jgi:hypothetical protein